VIPASLRWLLAGVVFTLAACGTPYSRSGLVGVATGESERPVADRPPANENENRARIHVELGQNYLQAGNYGTALDEAKAAIGYDRSYSPAYLLIATTYMFLDDQAAARANFEQAIQMSPSDPEINNTYGLYLCANGQEKEGLEHLAVAMRNPYYRTPSRPQFNAGLCYLRLKDDVQAEAAFLRAVQQDPANSQAYLELADIAYRRGNYDAAQKYIGSLQKLGPPSAAAAWLGLRIERKLGNKEAAAGYAQQLKTRFPTSAEYQLLLQGRLD
jgi:type IV pilus assembly protein PilF